MVKIEQTGGRLTEEEILHGKEDAYGIYQVNRKGAGRDYAFLSFDSLRSKGKVPERTEYQLVYSDILGADENRDSLFTKFNIAHPDDFTGHSLSVSDIILIKRNGKVNVSYVDMIGFVPLPDFYKEPSLRVVEQITESTKGFTAEGHFGTWHSIQMQEFHNEKFFQMRHDEFGKQVADIIVNEQGQVIAEDLWHGFSPEAMKLIGEYLLDKSLHDKKEAAYILSADKGYFLIHETDEGYDYTFYDQEYQELDGGIYDNLDVSLKEAIEDILNDAGETIENIKETDYEKLEQEIEEAEEAGLLESVIQESKRRLQEGDVALSYEGTISEDTFFNYLKEDMLYARNIPIDINPIRKEKSGTLSEYMQRAEYYLDEMEIKNFAIEVDSLARSYDNLYVYKTMSQEEAADAITEDILHKKSDYIKDFLKATEKSETESDVKKGKDMFIQMEKLERLSIFEREPETIPEVDFYVAECSEFPTLGEYYDGLTLAEAIAIYEKIPGERLNGVKGIGIDLHFPDDDMYSGKCDLLAGGRICREMLDAVPRYKENREVRKAVKYLENHFNKKEELSLSKPKKQEQAPRL